MSKIETLAKLAVKVGVSPLVVGLTIVAFGTSSPELFVCLNFNFAGDANAAELVKRYRVRPAIELYDISKDPLEMNNIAENPENAPVIKELRAKLDAWMLAQGDKGAQTEMEALEHQGRNRKKKKAGDLKKKRVKKF